MQLLSVAEGIWKQHSDLSLFHSCSNFLVILQNANKYFTSCIPWLTDESAILLYNINIKIKDMSLYLIIWMGRDVLQTEPMGLSSVRSWCKAVQLTFFMLEYVFPIAYSRYRSSRALRLWTLEQILLISRPIHHRQIMTSFVVNQSIMHNM